MQFLLLKFVEAKFHDAFLRGNLYFNTLEYFAGLERDSARSDPAEGAATLRRFKSIEIKALSDAEYTPIGGLLPGLVWRSPRPSGVNVHCMYWMTDDAGFPVDERNFAFGDFYIAIFEPNEFLRRVVAAAKRMNREPVCDRVEYVDRNSHDGEMGPFRKLLPYAYQFEYRFVLYDGTNAPVTLSIGDIRDICSFGPLRMINQHIQLNPLRIADIRKGRTVGRQQSEVR